MYIFVFEVSCIRVSSSTWNFRKLKKKIMYSQKFTVWEMILCWFSARKHQKCLYQWPLAKKYQARGTPVYMDLRTGMGAGWHVPPLFYWKWTEYLLPPLIFHIHFLVTLYTMHPSQAICEFFQLKKVEHDICYSNNKDLYIQLFCI